MRHLMDRLSVVEFVTLQSEKRTPRLDWDGFEPVTERGVVRQPRQSDLGEDGRHL